MFFVRKTILSPNWGTYPGHKRCSGGRSYLGLAPRHQGPRQEGMPNKAPSRQKEIIPRKSLPLYTKQPIVFIVPIIRHQLYNSTHSSSYQSTCTVLHASHQCQGDDAVFQTCASPTALGLRTITRVVASNRPNTYDTNPPIKVFASERIIISLPSPSREDLKFDFTCPQIPISRAVSRHRKVNTTRAFVFEAATKPLRKRRTCPAVSHPN